MLFGLDASASLAAAAWPAYPEDFHAYLAIGANGRVTVFSGKIEMGQGVMTSLAQMAAEELGVDLASIDMVMGDTDKCPWDMGTFGSLTTRMFGPALRAAAAKARAVLTALAAAKLGVAADRVTIAARRGIGCRRAGPAGQLRRIGRRRRDRRDGEPEGGAAVRRRLHRDGQLAEAARRHREGDGIGEIRRRHPPSGYALRAHPAPAGSWRGPDAGRHERRGETAGRNAHQAGRPDRRAACRSRSRSGRARADPGRLARGPRRR